MERSENDYEGKKRQAGNDIFEEKKGGGKSRKDRKRDKLEKRNQNKIKRDTEKKAEGTEENKDQSGWLSGKTFDPKRDLKSEKFENYYRVSFEYLQIIPFFICLYFRLN